MPDDATYLIDMLNAARMAKRFVAGLDRESFWQSELHQSAAVRQLEIIGEAARCITQEFKDAHPEISWKLMIGMRHRIVHDYTRINLDTVWDTLQQDLAPLIDQLKPLIPPESDDDDHSS